MIKNNYQNIGRKRIKEIFKQDLGQIEFIESVFREWVKLNQMALNNKYFSQKGVSRHEANLDTFSLWLVDNIYLQVYCKTSDNKIVKEFCVKHYGYKEGELLEN